MPAGYEVEILDSTGSIDLSTIQRFERLVRFSLETEDVTPPYAVRILLTTDDRIAELHEEFLGIPGPTDIMTFPDADEPEGDIVISVEQADRQRLGDQWTLEEELAFLVVHGILHLTGWDDATESDRRSMLDRQRRILSDYDAASSSAR